MAVTLRPAVQSDIPYLYTICLKTGDNGKDATHLFYDPWLLGQYYAAPYLFYDISLCFIAEEDNSPKGYVIGAENTPVFNQWLETVWLPPLRKRYPIDMPEGKVGSINERNMIVTVQKEVFPADTAIWISQYPAHLHIDLLPDLQGKGCGRLLIDSLLAELTKRACPGIHLGVSGKNVNAIGFYEKLGFTILTETEWGQIMGKKLS